MEDLMISRRSFARRASLGVVALLMAILMYAGMAAGTVPKASATNFCTNVNLAPYGHYGDRCYQWVWEASYLIEVGIITHERAGCVTYAAPDTYDLQAEWSCAGKYGGVYKYVRQDGLKHRGVIRNNNLSYAGEFDGFYGGFLP